MIDWTPEKYNRLTELISAEEGYSEYKIADILTDEFNEIISRDAVRHAIIRVNTLNIENKPIPDYMPYYSKYKDAIINKSVEKIFIPDNNLSLTMLKERLKILHLGDPHVPFQDDWQIQTAINRNKSADIALVTEIMDCYSVSRFNKNMSIPLEVEIDGSIRFLEIVSESFPLVFLMSGNHDRRIRKDVVRSLRPELQFLTDANILEYIARPFANVIVFDQPILQVNDAVFAHSETFSKVDLKAGTNVRNFLIEWKESLGLNDFRLVVQSHTHMLGSTYRGGTTKIMESGCLCKVPDYALAGFYSKPQTNGYVVVNQQNGVTDFNATREYVFPTQRYVPTGGLMFAE